MTVICKKIRSCNIESPQWKPTRTTLKYSVQMFYTWSQSHQADTNYCGQLEAEQASEMQHLQSKIQNTPLISSPPHFPIHCHPHACALLSTRQFGLGNDCPLWMQLIIVEFCWLRWKKGIKALTASGISQKQQSCNLRTCFLWPFETKHCQSFLHAWIFTQMIFTQSHCCQVQDCFQVLSLNSVVNLPNRSQEWCSQ